MMAQWLPGLAERGLWRAAMAVRLNPCFGCALKEGCAEREAWRKRVAGLGLRSATFRCAKLGAELRPGRRIEISTVYTANVHSQYSDHDTYDMGRKDVRATITYVDANGDFTCTIDPGQISEEEVTAGTDINKIRFRRKMRPSRIKRFLFGPDWDVCKGGGHVILDGKCDGADRLCQCDIDRKNEEMSASTGWV